MIWYCIWCVKPVLVRGRSAICHLVSSYFIYRLSFVRSAPWHSTPPADVDNAFLLLAPKFCNKLLKTARGEGIAAPPQVGMPLVYEACPPQVGMPSWTAAALHTSTVSLNLLSGLSQLRHLGWIVNHSISGKCVRVLNCPATWLCDQWIGSFLDDPKWGATDIPHRSSISLSQIRSVTIVVCQ